MDDKKTCPACGNEIFAFATKCSKCKIRLKAPSKVRPSVPPPPPPELPPQPPSPGLPPPSPPSPPLSSSPSPGHLSNDIDQDEKLNALDELINIPLPGESAENLGEFPGSEDENALETEAFDQYENDVFVEKQKESSDTQDETPLAVDTGAMEEKKLPKDADSKKPEIKKQKTKTPVIYIVAALIAVLIIVGVFVLMPATPQKNSKNDVKNSNVISGSEEKPKETDLDNKIALDSKLKKNDPVNSNCKNFDMQPDFPWKDKLLNIAKLADAVSLCDLFAVKKSKLISLLSDFKSFSTGYDLLTKGFVSDIFFGDTTARAPAMRFIFVDEKLVEIRLNYKKQLKKEIPEQNFIKVFGDKVFETFDSLGRSLMNFESENFTFQKMSYLDSFKSISNRLVIFPTKMKAAVKKENGQKEKALMNYDSGMINYEKRNFTDARTDFVKAIAEKPGFGMAHIIHALIELHYGNFNKVEKIAKIVLEKSRNKRAQAQAHGLLAIVELNFDNSEEALMEYKKAASKDSMDPYYRKSIKELETSLYAASQVAKTTARMNCRGKGIPVNVTVKQIISRGNFAALPMYKKALKKAKKEKSFSTEIKKWTMWECSPAK